MTSFLVSLGNRDNNNCLEEFDSAYQLIIKTC